jgi:putative nucleotidyltransferase with HDIG domain
LEEARLEILYRLARAAEFRDDQTGRHTLRVGRIAGRIAQVLGLQQEAQELIARAAPLHDIGKIGIPDGVLLKQDRLAPQERQIIQTHTVIGADILSGSRFALLQLAEEIALSHHERWDGRATRTAWRATRIPIAGRIVAVADVFDALTHDRPYKAAWTVREALTEIEANAGTQFDPAVVEALLRIAPEMRLLEKMASRRTCRYAAFRSPPPRPDPYGHMTDPAPAGAAAGRARRAGARSRRPPAAAHSGRHRRSARQALDPAELIDVTPPALPAQSARSPGPDGRTCTVRGKPREYPARHRARAAGRSCAVRRLRSDGWNRRWCSSRGHLRAHVSFPDPGDEARLRAAMDKVSSEIETLRAAGHDDLMHAVSIAASIVSSASRVTSSRWSHRDSINRQQTTCARTRSGIRARTRRGATAGRRHRRQDERTRERRPAQRPRGRHGHTAAVIFAAGLAGVLAIAAAGVLTHPLDRLRRSMARVADGTFEAPTDLPYDRNDEVGDLSRSFRTMTLRLAELDRLKAEFVGTASHDLKTPISIITGYAELIREELGGPLHARHRELLRSLSEQTLTLQRRVDQLLEISRMEAGRVRLGLEEINIRHFADEVRRIRAGLRPSTRAHARGRRARQRPAVPDRRPGRAAH